MIVTAMIPQQLPLRIQSALKQARNRVLIQDSGASFTGLQIKEFIETLQIRLQEISVPGDRVALFFPNLAVQSLAMLAVINCGRVPLMFSFEEHLQSGDKLKNQLNRFQVRVLLTHLSESVDTEIPQLRIDAGARISVINRGGSRRDLLTCSPDVALVLFTSGSTGEPKAVELTHQALLYTVDFLTPYLQLSAQTTAGITLPISHTMALNTQFLPTFLAGGRCVFMNSDLDKTKAFALIENSEATFLTVIGDILFLYDKEMTLRKLKPIEAVQHVQMAGGVIREKHLRMAQKLFPKAKIYKGYGLTEVIRTAMIDSDHPEFLSEAVGQVLPDQNIEVRNEDNQVLEFGQSGQIFIKGPSLMKGYQDESAPICERGFLATGDIGTLSPEGLLYINGRNDEIFKTLGKKVSAVEIERTVLALEMIEAAKCIRVPCDRKGYKPVLFVQPQASAQIQKDTEISLAIRKHLSQYLETYKVPTDVVVVGNLPKLPNQKINRKAVYALWDLQTEQTFSQ